MRVCTVASGSSGNCVYIGDGDTHILVDAGISRKKIVEGLKSFGVDAADLSAIFVTHEHSDHINGLKVLDKNYGIPIYGTRGTLLGINNAFKDYEFSEDRLNIIESDMGIKVDNLKITPFTISHDANEPVGFTVTDGVKKMSISTDLGVFTDYTIANLEGSEAIILEANHDISMLETGTYPYHLKRRILSDKGHLSNDASGDLLSKLIWKDLKHICLAHLSKDNNYPELALQTIKCSLWENLGMKEVPFDLYVANRNEPSKMITI
ncbi:MAG: MBL fold metallo-hydrolase [Lachnospiraceae bacterium]|nr:MBL fold metallo-hydrolase [Lachnospiraceae bacterium]